MKAGNIQPDSVDSVVVGNVLTAAASDCPYVARHTALRSGLRLETPANTVNRLCGSGFQVRILSKKQSITRMILSKPTKINRHCFYFYLVYRKCHS